MTGVLVVDESRGRRTAVGNALADRGFEVRTASDCDEGRASAGSSTHDVVIVGVEGDDRDAGGTIRRILSMGRTPVVAVTDGRVPEDLEEVAGAGGIELVSAGGTSREDTAERVVEAVERVEGTAASELATAIASASARSVQRTVGGGRDPGAWTDPDLPPRAKSEGTTGESGGAVRADGARTAGRSGWPAGRDSTVDVEVPSFDPPAGEFAPTVVVGASAGGPDVVETVLGGLPRDLDARVLVVQHMPESFTGRLARHLDAVSEYDVSEAADGALVGGGEAVVAKGDHHLSVASTAGDRLRVRVTGGDRVHGVRPAVDVTMRSVAENATEPLVGVVLTGMGRDGAAGVGAVSEAGGLVFAQDRASSPVFGMPEQAIATGVVDEVRPPEEIPRAICDQLREGDNEQ